MKYCETSLWKAVELQRSLSSNSVYSQLVFATNMLEGLWPGTCIHITNEKLQRSWNRLQTHHTHTWYLSQTPRIYSCKFFWPVICPKYAKNIPKIPKICLGYAQYMPKICQKYAQDMPKICLGYFYDMPTICQRYAQDIAKICLRYAQDMPKICPRFVQYIPKICQDMPKIC